MLKELILIIVEVAKMECVECHPGLAPFVAIVAE